MPGAGGRGETGWGPWRAAVRERPRRGPGAADGIQDPISPSADLQQKNEVSAVSLGGSDRELSSLLFAEFKQFIGKLLFHLISTVLF